MFDSIILICLWPPNLFVPGLFWDFLHLNITLSQAVDTKSHRWLHLGVGEKLQSWWQATISWSIYEWTMLYNCSRMMECLSMVFTIKKQKWLENLGRNYHHKQLEISSWMIQWSRMNHCSMWWFLLNMGNMFTAKSRCSYTVISFDVWMWFLNMGWSTFILKGLL